MKKRLNELKTGDIFEDDKGDSYEIGDYCDGMVEVLNLETRKKSCWPIYSVVSVW